MERIDDQILTNSNVDTIILSYPRSGANWIRYIVEYITKRPTYSISRFGNRENPYLSCQDNSLNLPSFSNSDIQEFNSKEGYKNPILFHVHNFDIVENLIEVKNIIFIIRNYKECIHRHIGYESEKWDYQLIRYLNILEQYDLFKGNKIIIYYGDMIKKPRKHIKKIIEFLKCDMNLLDEFMSNFDKYKQDSISVYQKGANHHSTFRSNTNGDEKELLYHSNNVNFERLKEMDKIVKDYNLDLFNKYLKRYVCNVH